MLLFVWFLPVAVLISICTIFGASGMGIGLGFMWLGLCVYQDAFVVRRQEYVVIERLGKFHKANCGLSCK